MANKPHHAYMLVWRTDSSSLLHWSVCILFSCLHSSHFLLFPLNSATHILQHGDRHLGPQIVPASEQPSGMSDFRSKAQTSPVHFCSKDGGRPFCHSALRYICNSWQVIHHCLLWYLTWATSSHSQCNAKPWQSIPCVHGDSTQCRIDKQFLQPNPSSLNCKGHRSFL